jgi:hypothetical protein
MPFSRPKFVSDLLPSVDGLFLGETITPRRWDGSKLINLPLPITLHGGRSNIEKDTWVDLGFCINDGYDWIYEIPVKASAPTGKTFKLRAFGSIFSTANYKFRAVKTGFPDVVIKESSQNVQYEAYDPPISVEGACEIRLQGGYFGILSYGLVSGYMVFSIE